MENLHLQLLQKVSDATCSRVPHMTMQHLLELTSGLCSSLSTNAVMGQCIVGVVMQDRMQVWCHGTPVSLYHCSLVSWTNVSAQSCALVCP